MAALGLAGEAGEFVELVKKGVFHEVGYDPERLANELGDLLFYATFAANTLGMTLGEIIDRNRTKLTARYPAGHFRVEDFLAKEAAKHDPHSST